MCAYSGVPLEPSWLVLQHWLSFMHKFIMCSRVGMQDSFKSDSKSSDTSSNTILNIANTWCRRSWPRAEGRNGEDFSEESHSHGRRPRRSRPPMGVPLWALPASRYPHSGALLWSPLRSVESQGPSVATFFFGIKSYTHTLYQFCCRSLRYCLRAVAHT